MNEPRKQTINTDSLTTPVHRIVAEFYDVSPQCVGHIITEALYQAARQVRQGHAVELEHIGKLNQFTALLGGAVSIDFTPDPDLKDRDHSQAFVERERASA